MSTKIRVAVESREGLQRRRTPRVFFAQSKMSGTNPSLDFGGVDGASIRSPRVPCSSLSSPHTLRLDISDRNA